MGINVGGGSSGSSGGSGGELDVNGNNVADNAEALGGQLPGAYQLRSERNTADGYAGLDGTGKVPAALLPSYVDDVLEAASFAALPVTGETGKLYVTTNNNKQYRWSGSAYVEIAASPGSTDAVPEGAVNLYFTTARVLATALGALTLQNVAIAAGDTLQTWAGKAQGQINALWSWINAAFTVVSTTITHNLTTVFSKPVRVVAVTANVTGNYTPDGSLSNSFVLTLTGTTLMNNPINLIVGAFYDFVFIQDGTGGRLVDFGTAYDFGGTNKPQAYTSPGAATIISGKAIAANKILFPPPTGPTTELITQTTATYTAGHEDCILQLLSSGSSQSTNLPHPPPRSGKPYQIRNMNPAISTNVVGENGALVEGQESYILAPGAYIHVRHNGSHYYRVS